MTETKELALVNDLIQKVRGMRGLHVVPESMTPVTALETIRKIQHQRRELHQSGVIVAQRQLTKHVCEAQIFSLDEKENGLLQYAYQVVAMYYFGNKRVANAARQKYISDGFASQTSQSYGRE